MNRSISIFSVIFYSLMILTIPTRTAFAGEIHNAIDKRDLKSIKEIIRKNPEVCLVFEADAKIESAPDACSYTTKYRSVMAWGKATIQEEPQEKAFGMNVLMKHYTGEEFEFPAQALARMVVIRVDIEKMTGKQNL